MHEQNMNYMHCFIQMNEPPLWVWPTSSMIVMMSQWIMGVCSDLHFTNRCIVGSCSYVCVSERNPCALKTTWRRGHEDTQLRMLRNPLTLWNTPFKMPGGSPAKKCCEWQHHPSTPQQKPQRPPGHDYEPLKGFCQPRETKWIFTNCRNKLRMWPDTFFSKINADT